MVCALRDIFVGLKTAAHDHSSKDAVAPTALRVALSALYSDSDFFQEVLSFGQFQGVMYLFVLLAIFYCINNAQQQWCFNSGQRRFTLNLYAICLYLFSQHSIG